MTILEDRKIDIINFYTTGSSLSEISKKIEDIYNIKISRQRVHQILKFNGVNTKSGGHNLIIEINNQRKKLKKLKQNAQKKEIQEINIYKYFGNTYKELKYFDHDFKIIPISNYLNKNKMKSKYSFLYKKYLHSSLFYLNKDKDYLKFLDWVLFLKENNNIYYIESIKKYNKDKRVFIKKIDKNLPWGLTNIKTNKQNITNE